MLVRYLTSLLLLGPLALAKDIYLEWDIGYVNANPDGKFERQVIGCNGKFPFNPVEADYGDTLYINVHNSLSEVTSLHSHGIFFHGNNQFDGSPGVTECGIPPGRNFTYTIPLQQWGTYWIHSHSGPQYVDGWRTALIIKPPKDRRPVSYNGEYLLTVSDWFYESAVSLGKHYLSLKNPGGGEPSPNSALFNETVSPTLSFEPGNKYRIRIINYSAAAIFYFSVDGHDMEIIEIDGVDVEPTKAGTVEIAAAQRYSVLITAREDTSKNYLIHADLDVTKLDSIQAGLRPNLTATIVYDEGADTEPEGDRFWDAYDDFDLVPVYEQDLGEPSTSIDMTVTFNQLDDGMFNGMFNDITYRAPKVPTLYTVKSLGQDALNQEVYGRMTNTYVFDNNETVQVVLLNGDGDPHPFHLHGNTFQVVARGDDINEFSVDKIPNNPNPMRRDTVVLPAEGYVVLRFLADNPGAWLFHCHNEWHMISGLSSVFVVDPISIQNNQSISSEMQSFCPYSNFKTEGNAAGNKGLSMTGDLDGPHVIDYSIHGSGIGALAACVISAVLGFLAVIWYSLSDPALDPKPDVDGAAFVVADKRDVLESEDSSTH